MTHETEFTYEEWKTAHLRARYGADNVVRQHRLDTGRLVDLLIYDPERNIRWAWELENDAGSVLNGSGQARYYAARVYHEDPTQGAVLPVLGVPEGHIDPAERADLESTGLRVVEDTLPEDVSASGV